MTLSISLRRNNLPTPAHDNTWISVGGLILLISLVLRVITAVPVREKMFSEETSFPPTHMISLFYSQANIFGTLPGMLVQKDCWPLLLVPCKLQPGSESCSVCFTYKSQILSGTLCHPKVSSPIYSCPSLKEAYIYTSQSSAVLLKGWRALCVIFSLWLPVKFPSNILAEGVSEGSSYPQEGRVTFWSSLS